MAQPTEGLKVQRPPQAADRTVHRAPRRRPRSISASNAFRTNAIVRWSGDDNSAELAGNISNLLQKIIATENCQVLFIGQLVKWSTCCPKRRTAMIYIKLAALAAATLIGAALIAAPAQARFGGFGGMRGGGGFAVAHVGGFGGFL